MKIGFIGAGNMGKAIIGGLINSKMACPSDIIASAKSASTVEKLKSDFKIEASNDNVAVAKASDVLFLAIKPAMLAEVVAEIKDAVNNDQIIVSIVAGQSLTKLESLFGKKLKFIRVMPNTPALVNEAMSALSPNELVSDEEATKVLKMFESFGEAEIVPEKLQDAVVGVSGSSPAYVYMFIEALADGAVAEGMPRKMAYKFAAQSVLGSAKMVLETGEHPGVLKDAVCSPAGTTIEAVAALEAAGFRSSVIEAERICVEKSRNL